MQRFLCYLGWHRWVGEAVRAREMWGEVRYDLPLRRYCSRCDEFYPLWPPKDAT